MRPRKYFTAVRVAVGAMIGCVLIVFSQFVQEIIKARTYHGRTMNQWLDVLKTAPFNGTNALQLHQMITGNEPRAFP
jgi:hypothetical protein